ncbi:40S ribosomal protein S28 [Histoplasma capsulatum var. duboisii H88]|uniref:40S ribosomal protein S28 n=1 Tax=Ajellomyces capsulatus (strain H88) TaxID=544711 RepID=A0A8A1LCI1_AJEC8|nr:40S ribosomal protein S28 [Histoplasma capsulatum var. duboisii H88]
MRREEESGNLAFCGDDSGRNYILSRSSPFFKRCSDFESESGMTEWICWEEIKGDGAFSRKWIRSSHHQIDILCSAFLPVACRFGASHVPTK